MKASSRVIAFLLYVALVVGIPTGGFTQNARPDTAVRVRVDDGSEVKLYDASFALVVGLSDYTGGWADLPGVALDVPVVKKALERQGFFVTVVMNPTRAAFDETMRKFINDYGYDAGNRLLIYFAGHGYTQKDALGDRDLGYIVPADAPRPGLNERRFRQMAISMDTIENYARQIESKHALFIFDSCFSGSLISKTRGGVPPTITSKTTLPVRQFITAGADSQEVPDVSIFREQFIEGLEGEADLNRDSYVTGSELATHLQDKVTNYTRESQTPQYGKIRDARLDRGDFVFVLPRTKKVTAPPAATVTPPRPLDPAALELAFWDAIKTSADPEDYRDYLAKYPNGQFAALARRRAQPAPAVKEERTLNNESTKSVTSAPTIEGTTWLVKTSDGQTAVVQFLSGGKITYKGASTTVGTWRQQNKIITFDVNNYSTWEGIVNGDAMDGGARNAEKTWTWTAANSGGSTATTTAVPKRAVTTQSGIELVYIPAGTFRMGSDNGDPDEKPVHEVTIRNGFYMGKYEVTQAQWQRVMGNNPSNFKGENLPVEQVSWLDAQEFIRKLNGQHDGYTYRLPTEAEWEYGCRAETTGDYAGKLDDMAWYGNNAGRARLNADEIWRTDQANYGKRIIENGNQTHAVGSKVPNAFGLHDMHGNVLEWCEDLYHDSYWGAPTDGSAWLLGGEQKYLLRGGSWNIVSSVLRSANRNRRAPDARTYFFGFRVVASLGT